MAYVRGTCFTFNNAANRNISMCEYQRIAYEREVLPNMRMDTQTNDNAGAHQRTPRHHIYMPF